MQKKVSKQKMKISVELPFGPFQTMEQVTEMKKVAKAKTAKISFTSATKSSRGYAFKGKISFIKMLSIPAATVKQALQTRLPNARISVTRV